MENIVNKDVCDEKMRNIEDKLALILNNTNDIKKEVLVIPILHERISILERWKESFWKTVVWAMISGIAIASGLLVALNRLRF